MSTLVSLSFNGKPFVMSLLAVSVLNNSQHFRTTRPTNVLKSHRITNVSLFVIKESPLW